MNAERPVHILLVEDNPGDVLLAQETLARASINAVLHVARDGREGLRFLRREEGFAEAPRPDLILLDLNLPRLKGREVLAEVKQDPELRAIPVVVLTSSSAEPDVLGSYREGANCYINKPMELDELERVVASISRFWFGIARLPSGP